MSHGLFGLAAALLGGVLVGLVNYILTAVVLRRKASLYATFSVVRQLLHIGYLVALYLLAPYTPWDRLYLLIGGVLGMTVSMVVFTARLVRLSARLTKHSAGTAGSAPSGRPEQTADNRGTAGEPSDTDSGKGEDPNG